jgi:hypothetical protein
MEVLVDLINKIFSTSSEEDSKEVMQDLVDLRIF